MDKDYSKKDLERKKIPELKEILKKLNLKTSGNKDELIERILESQNVKTTKPSSTNISREFNYMDILPGDVKNIVNKYRVENEPNNLIIYQLINRYLQNYPGKDQVKKMGEYLEKSSIPFQIIKNRERQRLVEKADEEIERRISQGKTSIQSSVYNKFGVCDFPIYEPLLDKDIIIDNKLLMEFILDFIVWTRSDVRLDIGTINKILKDNNSKLVVVKINDEAKPGQKSERYHYYIGHFQSLMDIAR